MNKPKFTPGPWTVKQGKFDSLIVADGKDSCGDFCVARCEPCDAALIAAAPDLFAALEGVMDKAGCYCGITESDCDGCKNWRIARAALARARGEGKS